MSFPKATDPVPFPFTLSVGKKSVSILTGGLASVEMS